MTTENRKKLLEAASMFIGLLFITIGGFLIFSYVRTVINLQNQPDQSEIFWHLPIMFIGTALFGTGIYFGFISYKSINGNERTFGLIKTSLKSLGVVLLILVGVMILSKVLY